MQGHTCKHIFSGPVTHLLSMLCVLMKILSNASAKKKTKRLKGFKFRSFIGRFQVTVKGLSRFCSECLWNISRPKICIVVQPSQISLAVSVDVKHHVYLLCCCALIDKWLFFNTVVAAVRLQACGTRIYMLHYFYLDVRVTHNVQRMVQGRELPLALGVLRRKSCLQ